MAIVIKDRIGKILMSLERENHRGACPAASRQKSLVRIEVTTLRMRHADGTVDNTSRKEVFYRRPLLTNKGKLDRDRLALEILLRR
jgi:hypothetical protein